MNIFVAKLDFSTTSEELQAVFERFGEVTSAKVIDDKLTGKSKGYGFVEMPNEEEANEAINALNESELSGRTIVVKEATPKEDRPRRSFGGNSGGGGGYRPRPYGSGGSGGGGYRSGGNRYSGGNDRYSGGNDRYGNRSGNDRYGERNDRFNDRKDRYNDRYDDRNER
jgi:RNA recognition motif-containing protein